MSLYAYFTQNLTIPIIDPKNLANVRVPITIVI